MASERELPRCRSSPAPAGSGPAVRQAAAAALPPMPAPVLPGSKDRCRGAGAIPALATPPPAVRSQADQALLHRFEDGLAARVDLQLAVDALDVAGDREARK